MKIVDLAKKKWKIIKHENLSSRIKTRKETLAFGNIEIKKKKTLPSSVYFLGDVDIEKVLASNKISFGEKTYKYFIGYLYDNHKGKQLHIMLP